PLAQVLPCPSPVARPPDRRRRAGREAALGVAVQGQGPERIGVARVHADRKAEGGGQAGGNILPAPPAVRGPPDPMMVLLVEHVRRARCTHHVVYAMAGFAVPRRGGVVVPLAGGSVRKAVTPFPGRAAVLGGEDAGGRNADPELCG